MTVQCSASAAPSATGTAVASDNCDDDVTVSYDTAVAGTGNNSVITRVWTTAMLIAIQLLILKQLQ